MDHFLDVREEEMESGEVGERPFYTISAGKSDTLTSYVYNCSFSPCSFFIISVSPGLLGAFLPSSWFLRTTKTLQSANNLVRQFLSFSC